MPIKKGKIYQTYSNENLDNAIQAVRTGTLSQRKASKHYGIPQATLSDHLRGRTAPGAKPGRTPVLPLKVEDDIARKCSQAATMGLGMSRLQVLEKVGKIVKQMKIKNPFKRNVPGKDWWSGFKNRHSEITLRVPEKLTSVRARGLNAIQVGKYMKELNEIITRLNLKTHPEGIWNMDEKGVSMEHKPVKVVAAKTSRCTPGRCSNSRQSNTIIACINANGESMPPMVIVKGKTEKSVVGFNTADGPLGAKWTYQQNAWTEDILGVEWFCNVFLENCGPHRPQLLLMDGHHSHEVLGLIEKAIENQIHILVLPAHTTHYLCPLDRSVFGPFSAKYNSICSDFLQNPCNVVNKVTWPGLFSRAYSSSFTNENIRSGFRSCGIVPWNPLAIPKDAFSPSDAFDSERGTTHQSDNHPLEWALNSSSSPTILPRRTSTVTSTFAAAPTATVTHAPASLAPPVTFAPTSASLAPPVTFAPTSASLAPPVTFAPTSASLAPPVTFAPTSASLAPPVTFAPTSASLAPPVTFAPTPASLAPPVTFSPTPASLAPPVTFAPTSASLPLPYTVAPTPVSVAIAPSSGVAPTPASLSFGNLDAELDDSVFLNDTAPFLLLPAVDDETRVAVETLISLDVSSPDPTPSKENIPPSMMDWNGAVTDMFSIAPPPTKKSKGKIKHTGHRLLTSKEVLEEKKRADENKKAKRNKKGKPNKDKGTEFCKEVVRHANKRIEETIKVITYDKYDTDALCSRWLCIEQFCSGWFRFQE